MTYHWEGRYPGSKDPRTRTKGVMRTVRAMKRAEAEERQRHYRESKVPVQVQVRISL